MEIHLIWAQDKNGGIGEDGKLPWHVSEDLKNFKQLTLHSTIIMGRKTWDSLPVRPLPKRENIILSSKKQSSGTTYHSVKECLEDLKNSTLIPAMLVPERIPVSLTTVSSWIFQGKLPVVKIGRMVFIRKEVLEKIEMEGLESVTAELNNN